MSRPRHGRRGGERGRHGEGLRADKRLGQHFLRDGEILSEIAAIADLASASGALEIGPGEGALTAFLARTGKPIVALEKDPRAVAAVEARFEGGAVRVVQGDATDASVDLASLLPGPDANGRLPVVVGNLPYNAGSAIYRRLLGLDQSVSRLVLMFQREVALRIVAEPGHKAYGMLSVVTRLGWRAWPVLDVPPHAFEPRPKVDSAVVLVEPLAEPVVPREEHEAIARTASRLYQSRRKVLSNAVDDPDVLAEVGLDPAKRPEDLRLEELIALSRALRAREDAEG